MKEKPEFVARCILVGGLVTAMMSSCSQSVQIASHKMQEIQPGYSTVSAMLTRTAESNKTLVSHADPNVPLAGTISPTQKQKTPTPNAGMVVTNEITEKTVTQNQEGACDSVQAGNPIDVTIPDDTRFEPGQVFTKTWRLFNSGTCTWNRDYAVVWFSGTNFSLVEAQPFFVDVKPGNYVEVSLDMVAPPLPGSYQSNWKLRNSKGQLFGLGPLGDAPFWVRIVVVPLETRTTTPMLPLPTSTPAIFASGTLSLQFDQKADLDNGLVDQPMGNDLIWQKDKEDLPEVMPEEGAKFAIFGRNTPGMYDCLKVPVTDQPLRKDQLQEGVYICYRTTAGLPGRIFISTLDVENDLLDVEFVTWVVP